MLKFEIEKQRADKALINFAKQSNQTIIFSFELTKQYQANDIHGFYSFEAGLNQLLLHSGLQAKIDNLGKITISADNTITQINDILKTASRVNNHIIEEIDETEKISIIGSRVAGRSADDLPVPVDILTTDILSHTGQTELGRILQTIAPSFNFSSSAISDGTDALRPATLRGLGPDQTLVLINGKRRHQASLIHINPTVGRGTAGTDINAIPAAAIKRIEVLRDGAAAQYGSDAIAGVINIVLNDISEGGKSSLIFGKYTLGDGDNINLNLSKGFSFNDSGFLTATLNIKNAQPTNRAGLHGSCQFDNCTSINSNINLAGDPRELTAARKTFRIGDTDSQQIALTINSAYEVPQGEFYGFITYSNRNNESAAFFRHNANQNSNPTLQDNDATIPSGFLPKINSEINDISYSLGYQNTFNNNSFIDVSYTYGENSINYTTGNSINASYANALQYATDLTANQIRDIIPREAYAYGLLLSLRTINFDFAHDFDFLSLAIGAEFRTDKFKVIPGNEYAYKDFDTDIFGNSLFENDAFAGIQGFIGTAPGQAVNELRDVVSFYTDIETQLTSSLLISSALRFDDYKEFGQSTNLKLAANWSLTPNIAIRGAVSSGFRAPSMQQLYTDNISTQFFSNSYGGDQTALHIGIFRNDSDLTKALSIPQLKEEEAINFSMGSVLKIKNLIDFTIDFYSIYIDDRIVLSNSLGQDLSSTLDSALKTSGVSAAQFFLNGADTHTKGVDIIATYNTPLLNGNLDLIFAANFTDTQVDNVFTPKNSALGNIAPEDIFSQQSISIITQWQPKDRISLNTLYQVDDFTFNLAFNRYGEYTVTDGGTQTYGAKILTDLQLNYQVNASLSFNMGGNNIFDIYPDKNKIGNSHSGTIIDNEGNLIVSSQGVFTYSRRSSPFGFNGAYYYIGVEYQF
ncbi:TonB-dependent receptor [Pseudoalteromonas sp. NBT06-2]|uniref:TonB-dependent receptor plug domain-containing protein n=1 Tax=Pseudoalteromonas sp. NBT06-2 TaxID=2025950 RepID=UPI002074B8F1|nr:TonB-dependent receptor [Pseudoalteromonas sp. NBT06-2]